MRTLARTAVLVVGGALVLGVAIGCEPDYQAGPQVPTPPIGGGAPQVAGPPNADAGVDAGVVPLRYRDDDFVESNVNRDPFRSFAKVFRTHPPIDIQRQVLMGNMGIDEIRLIAIVSGVPNPRAMFNDRAGVGYVVERGDWICRGETVQTAGEGAIAVILNWRVDRIRDGEVVVVRDDPTAPNRPPLTRVIPLHDENEAPAR